MTFLAFTKNVYRLSLAKKVDYIVKSFDDEIRFLEEIE